MPEPELTLAELNTMPEDEARQVLRGCCGASAWCDAMAQRRPFDSVDAVYQAAAESFAGLTLDDWLEAFDAHPKIGDLDSLRMKYAGNDKWSGGEQAGVNEADEQVLRRLAEGNTAYVEKFGHIFIVCASGKSAAEMLAILESRLPNDRGGEMKKSAIEQTKITRLRLEKLLT